MKYSIKSLLSLLGILGFLLSCALFSWVQTRAPQLLILLLGLGFLLSCASAPQQITRETPMPLENSVAAKTDTSTVRLVSQIGDSVRFSSGFFVDTNKIATNIHVVAHPGPVFAKRIDEETILAIKGVTAFDVENNLVILELGGEGIPLPIGDSDSVRSGTSVSIVGYPDGKYKVTASTIDSIQKSTNWFSMEGTAAKESCGGPVLNGKGEVIGVAVWSGSDSHSYAIPSNALKALLAQSMTLEPLVEWQKRETIRTYAYFVHGYSKYEAEHYDEAITALNRAIHLNSQFTAAYYIRALAHDARKDYEKAILDYDAYIELNPDDATAYRRRGYAKRRLGTAKSEQDDFSKTRNLYHAAIEDYTRAIQLDPKYARAFNNRGWVRYLLGKYEAEEAHLAEAQQLYHAAIDDYTQALKISPKYASAGRNRGGAKAALGDIIFTQGDIAGAYSLYHAGIADYYEYEAADVNVPTSELDSKKYRKSTVRVMSWTGTTSGFYYGSGFFVDTDKIVTNIHVVDLSGPVFVKLIDMETIWTVTGVVAFDAENDLTVLKVAGEGTPLKIGNSDAVQSGEPVVAVGYPGKKYKVLAGTVQGTKNGGQLLRTTVDASSGSSGGPVLNSKNEVIGIHARSDNSYSYEIPSNILKHLLKQSESVEPLAAWQKRDQILAYTYFGKGKKKSHAEEYEAAIVDFTKAIQLNPKYARAYFERGLAVYKAGNLITAIDDYTHAIKLNPKYTNAYRNRGNVKYSLGKSKAEQGNITAAQQLYQAAIDDYTMSIKIDPKYHYPYFKRGLTRRRFGQSKAAQGDITAAQQLYQAAIDDYTHTLKLNPKYTLAYNNRGYVKYSLGKSIAEQGAVAEAERLYQAAIADYTHALKLNPKYVKAHNNRGHAKKALGQHKAAEKDYQKAKKLKSDE